MALPAISLFSGAGGLDLGIERAGFTTRVCVERDRDCLATLEANRHLRKYKTFGLIGRDIADVPTKEILERAKLEVGEAALLVGGPPCQPFSKSGNWTLKPKDGSEPKVRGINDPEAKKALDAFVRILREAKPKAFLMENVHGLAYSVNDAALSLVLRGIPRAYQFRRQVLNAAGFGVPQLRERLFIVGWRTAGDFTFPLPTHAAPKNAETRGLKPYRAAGDVLADLDLGNDIPKGDELIGERYRALLPGIPEGENYLFYTKERGHPEPRFRWRSKYWSFLLKLSREKPSWTIQAQQGPYTGPFHWRNRKLRIRELQRLQTFPDEFEFRGAKAAILSQIGNAVPCELGAALGRAIHTQLFAEKRKQRVAGLVCR